MILSKICLRILRKLAHEPRKIEETEELVINDITLLINRSDYGGRMYDSKSSFEEYESFLYPQIESWLQPKLVIDVGANYGFTGLIYSKRFPKAKLILIEPSPQLAPFIKNNFLKNKITNYELICSACGEADLKKTSFALNPDSSQDNRVKGEADWLTIEVPSVTITSIINKHHTGGGVFIKIDTQGFERQVFEGGLEFFDRNSEWLVKTEFAPYWLTKQGSNPNDLLRCLIDRFVVAESPLRYRHNVDRLDQIFANCLIADDVNTFVNHIALQNREGRGWCDLLITPKKAKWLAQV